jgi:hypothetical protein
VAKKRSSQPPSPRPAAVPAPVTATPLETAFWALAGLLTFWPFGFTVLQGSDLWWHLAAGRWMAEHRAVPRVDPFSFTRFGEPWHHHEWLSGVVYELWGRLFGGPEALVYWKWTLVVGTYLLLAALLARRTGSLAAGWLAALFALAVAAPFLDIRPHLWSLLGTVALFWLALARPRFPWVLPVLVLFWVNLHGGFFFGLLALSLLLLVDAILAWRAGGLGAFLRSRSPIVWALCLAAALLNPYGLEAFTYPLRYAFDADSPFRTLGEWLPPRLPGGIRAPLFPAAVGVFAAAVPLSFLFGRRPENHRWLGAGLALGGLTLAMAWTSRRFIPLFGICLALLLAPLLARLFAALLHGPLRAFAARRVLRLVPPLALAVAGAVALSRYPLGPRAFAILTSRESFPVEVCNFMAVNRLSGKVFVLYNWGGYLQLCGGGRLKVSIDGRADTVYTDEIYRRYLRLLGPDPGWERVVEESGADYVLWRAEDVPVVKGLYESGRWRPLYEDVVGVLFARGDLQLPALGPTPESPEQQLGFGMNSFRRARLDLALPALERSLELDPLYLPACRTLALVKAAADDPAGARATAARCEKIFPGAVRPGLLEEIAANLRRGGG